MSCSNAIPVKITDRRCFGHCVPMGSHHLFAHRISKRSFLPILQEQEQIHLLTAMTPAGCMNLHPLLHLASEQGLHGQKSRIRE